MIRALLLSSFFFLSSCTEKIIEISAENNDRKIVYSTVNERNSLLNDSFLYGDMFVIDDNLLICTYTHFGHTFHDDSLAVIDYSISNTGGRDWVYKGCFIPNIGKLNVSSIGFARVNSRVVHFYFSVKESRTEISVHRVISYDNCSTWSDSKEIYNEKYYTGSMNGNVVRLASGRIVLPLYYFHDSSFMYDSSLPIEKGRCFALYSDDGGNTYSKSNEIVVDDYAQGGAEPTIVEHNNLLLMSIRTYEGDYQYYSTSENNGNSWTTPQETSLNAPNTPVKLFSNDNRLYAIHNTKYNNPIGIDINSPRNRLVISELNETNNKWNEKLILNYDEKSRRNFTYPSVVENRESFNVVYSYIYYHLDRYISDLRFVSIPKDVISGSYKTLFLYE